MIQAVIFDIDNTLYDYDAAHAVAFQALTEYAQHTLGVDPETFEALHQRANQLLQARTGGDCAAIHNRLLRYQILLEELSQIFDVSPMTIRRDLQHLEDQGLISRFYGGAVAEQPVSPAGDADQVKLYRDLISQYAANLVAENDQIFINGSRTALGLLDFLGSKNVQVVTNNGLVCARKYPSNLRITLSGGEVRGQNAILTGNCTMRNLLMVHARKAFIGCTGISPNGELLCGIPTELGINETMLSHSDRYFILADHTKVGVIGTYASLHLEKMGTVITDELAPAAVVEQLRYIGMEVIQVTKGHPGEK